VIMKRAAFFLVLVTVTIGSLGCRSSSKAEAERQALAEQARLVAEEKKKAEAQAKEQQAKIDSLLSQLASAKDEPTRLALQKQLDAEKAKLAAGRKTGIGAPAKPCNCAAGDPLCSCL